MPDRASVTYRYRGNVEPSADVSRPVAARRAAANDTSGSSSATLDIFDVIDSYGGWWGISADDVNRALQAVGDVEEITVRLNSPGGEATEGVAISNLLRAHPAAITIDVIGLAASAASAIATAGDTVTMAPGALLMVHDAWGITIGNADEQRAAAQALDAISDSYADLYAMKAGGTRAQWRDVMRAETWMTADTARDCGLADVIATIQADPEPVGEPDAPDLEADDVAAARAAARRFDLSMFRHAPAALAPQTPAEPPETPPTNPEGADTMSDTLIAGLRERFGLPDDADEAAISAALDAQKVELDEAKAAARPKPTKTEAELPDGVVAVAQDVLDELKIAAQAGAEARAEQLRALRDTSIDAAVRDGRVAEARRAHWTAQWDADPEGTRTALAALEPVHPIGAPLGYAGDGGSTAEDASYTALFGDEKKED